jgi:hypothetical protein
MLFLILCSPDVIHQFQISCRCINARKFNNDDGTSSWSKNNHEKIIFDIRTPND